MIRLFVTDPLTAGAAFEATPDQARYLTGVMRLGPGDHLLVFNGRDGEWQAVVTEVTKRSCRLAPQAQTRPQTPPADIELVMALIKRGPLELVVEKATELGIGQIRLITTRRTNADHTNVSRLNAIAREAAEQCERLDVPEIAGPDKLDRLLETWPNGRRLLFCDEAGSDQRHPDPTGGNRARAGLFALNSTDPAPWSILVGPEGGFDPAERDRLLQHPAVTPVTLGPLILRAETAAIAALVLWQSTLGDWHRA